MVKIERHPTKTEIPISSINDDELDNEFFEISSDLGFLGTASVVNLLFLILILHRIVWLETR